MKPAILCYFGAFCLLGLTPGLHAQILLSTVTPLTAEPGLTNVTVTGSGFPAGTFTPGNITITLAPATPGAGPTVMTAATGIATVLGTIRRITFLVPATLAVQTPTPYQISLRDTTDGFSSTNQAGVTINPPASITSVSPNGGIQGQTVAVTVMAQYSNFLAGLTTLSAGSGIAISNVTVTSPTSLTASFAVDPNATLGPRTVTATSGGEIAALAGAFTVNPGSAMITSVSPSSGQQGQNLSLEVVGESTNFVSGATTAALGSGVAITSVAVADATHATVNITISPTAAIGPQTLTLRTGGSIATAAFSITAGPASLSSLNPTSGSQGQTLTVAVTGNATHFQNGITTANFGTGVAVNSVTVTSATSAMVALSIQDNAPVGPHTVALTTAGELASLTNGFTVNASPPVLLSLTPNTAAQAQTGLTVAIVGRFTHFVDSTTTAGFGSGVTLNSLTVTDPTHAMANITVSPLATLGSRDVTVTTGPESVTLAGGFTIQAGPASITSVSPNSGQQGQTLIGVVITGSSTHFTLGAPLVSFNNPGITVSGVVVTDNTHLTATLAVAANATLGAASVTVATGAETASGAGLFTVAAGTPTILTVNPSSGQADQTITAVAIAGSFTHFAQGLTTIHFSNPGVSASNIQVTDTIHLTTSLTIAANAATGPVNFTVITGSEMAAGMDLFTVTAGTPTILSLSPNSGQQGQVLTRVMITGNFTHFSQGPPTVTFSNAGITATNISVTDDTHITATLSLATTAATGPSNITVTTGAEVANGSGLFTVTASAPTILSLNPNAGQQGQTLNGIVITGNSTHFTSGTPTISFSTPGITASGIAVTDNTHLTATLAIAASTVTGSVNVTVTTGSEVATGSGLFTVTAGTPTLLSVSPNSGQPGQTVPGVLITGQFTHFTQGSQVTLSNPGVTASNLVVTDNTHLSVTLTVSASAASGVSNVTVTTGTEVATLVNGFTITVLSAPTITDFNPKSAPVGTLVTVTGSNLQPAGATSAQVTLAKQGGGTLMVQASSTSLTSLSFVIPSGSTTGIVSILVNGGSANTASPLTITPSSNFTITANPPSATLIQGQTVAYSVQLTSTNGFNQLAQLSLNGLPIGINATFQPASITVGQTSVLTLTAPSNQAVGPASLSIAAAATVDGLAVSQSTPATLAVVAPSTTLLGRTVVSDPAETPLAGVTITPLGKDGNGNTTGCTGFSTVSDGAGNFSLANLPTTCTGPQLIGFDGTTATSPAGIFAGR